MIVRLSLLAGALLATPALAQQEFDVSAAETRKLLHDYGACVVNRQRARAAEAIVNNVDNSTLIRRYSRLIDGSCLQPRPGQRMEVRFKGDQYRYALADALVRSEGTTLTAAALEAVPRLDHSDPGPAPSRVNDKGKPLSEKRYAEAVARHTEAAAFTYLSRYGECVVRANPAGAGALLRAVPATPAEDAAFGALRQAFGTCVPPGETLSFGKLALRGTVAINYYRLAHAARGPAERRS